MDAPKMTLCARCHGPRIKGGARGMCKQCYEGIGSGNACEICGKPISRRASRCPSCKFKGKIRTQEHCDHIRLSSWSRKYSHCQNCGTAERRHYSKGLCEKCYEIVRYRSHPRPQHSPCKIPDYRTREWLHQHYEVDGLSVKQCAELAEVESYVISHWLKRNDIQIDHGKGRRGAKRSQELKAYLSAKMQGAGNHFYGKRGPLCIHWRGGISTEPYPFSFDAELKQAIRVRDNHKCAICGKNTKKLCVHHIDYVKDNLAPNNLISLCPSCHSGTNSHRAYWQEHLSSLVKGTQDGQ
jgi:hypothetical protein